MAVAFVFFFYYYFLHMTGSLYQVIESIDVHTYPEKFVLPGLVL